MSDDPYTPPHSHVQDVPSRGSGPSKVRLSRVSPFQTAKVMAFLYLVVSIPLVGMVALMERTAGRPQTFAIGFYILAPFIYGLFGYVFSIVGAWTYNGVAKVFGGIEYTTIPAEEP
jgi:hypothetical protein